MQDRTLENKTRVTLKGKRYRVGNPMHPLHNLYKEKGWNAVYVAMGLAKEAWYVRLFKWFRGAL